MEISSPLSLWPGTIRKRWRPSSKGRAMNCRSIIRFRIPLRNFRDPAFPPPISLENPGRSPWMKKGRPTGIPGRPGNCWMPYCSNRRFLKPRPGPDLLLPDELHGGVVFLPHIGEQFLLGNTMAIDMAQKNLMIASKVTDTPKEHHPEYPSS